MGNRYAIALASYKKAVIDEIAGLLGSIYEIPTIKEKTNKGQYYLVCRSEDYVTAVLFANFFDEFKDFRPYELQWVTPRGKCIDIWDDEWLGEKKGFEYSCAVGCCGVTKIFKDPYTWRNKVDLRAFNRYVYVDVIRDIGKDKKLQKLCAYLRKKTGLSLRVHKHRYAIQVKSDEYLTFLEKMKNISPFAFSSYQELILPNGANSEEVEGLSLRKYRKADIRNIITKENKEKQSSEQQNNKEQKTEEEQNNEKQTTSSQKEEAEKTL